MDFGRKRKISGPGSFQLDRSSRLKVDNLFEKKFTFTKTDEEHWDLSSIFNSVNPTTVKWQIPDLMEMKTSLNELKDRLSDKEICVWHDHTNCMNMAGNVNSEIRHRIKPELCTQAWCKFYEILSSYEIVDFSLCSFNSVHLCEAPGAFVTSLNHYLVSRGYQGIWTWIASTLNPYYEGNIVGQMIDDDRFIRETFDHWYFGEDNTGNLMDWENLEGLVAITTEMAPVSLVTADGSIDCQDNPAEQEQVVAQLQLCEAFAALLILSPGGSLVLKKFTMFEHESICLMFILNCLFDKVHVFKPATSKSGNSEVYVICCGFTGIDGHKQQFKDYIKPFFSGSQCSISMCPLEGFPPSFLTQHKLMCQNFTKFQRETIIHNLDHYPSVSEQYSVWMQNVKDYCAEMYINRYEVISLSPLSRIVSNKHMMKSMITPGKKQKQFWDAKRRQGTFNDRSKLSQLPWKHKVQQIETYEVDLTNIYWFQRRFHWKEEDSKHLDCAKGKTLNKILSSKFCDGKLLQQLHEIFENIQNSNLLHSSDVNDVVLRSLSCIIQMSQKAIDSYTLVLESENSLLSSIDIPKLQTCNCVVKVESGTANNGPNPNLIYVADLNQTDQQFSCSRELSLQSRLIDCVLDLLRKMFHQNSAIILMNTCLTRRTTGVVYLLSQCFQKVGFLPQPGGSTMQQVLVCYNCTGVLNTILEHLRWIQTHFRSQSHDQENILLEVVPIKILASDVEFVQFVKASNETLLKSYITEAVRAETSVSSDNQSYIM